MSREKLTLPMLITTIHNTKGTVYLAARQLQVSPQTVYNYAKRHPTVQEAIDSERGMLLDTAELALWKAVQNGEAWAVSLTLKTIGRHRGYVERAEITGGNGGPIDILETHVVESQLDRDIARFLVEMAHKEAQCLAPPPTKLPRGFQEPLQLDTGPETD